MLAIYALAALPFFAGGPSSRWRSPASPAGVNVVYAADLVGAAAGCLLLIPLLNTVGAPGAVLVASLAAAVAAVLLQAPGRRARIAVAAALVAGVPAAVQLSSAAPFDVRDTKGHRGDRVLFSRWNSFSRVAVYDRGHGDWSMSPRYTGPRPDTRFMDIDSAASTPIVRFDGDLARVESLRLRADVARLSPAPGHERRPARQAFARSSSDPAADATCSRRCCSARRTSTASRSIRSSPTT